MEILNSTILVVDDSGSNIDILIGLLGDSYDIVVATNGDDAVEIAQSERVDLILLDIMMPKMDGYTVCKVLKSDEKTVDIPIIFVTAKTDEQSIEKAFDVGGVDYVTKPFKAKELQARVKTHLKLQNSLQKLDYLASMDSMTGSYNRRKFFELAKKRMDEIDEHWFAVMIDLDHFKTVNDSFGHHVGDEILKKTVTTIQNALNSEEIFGRLGGEEFAILMQADSVVDIQKRLDCIKDSVAELFILTSDAQKVHITASFGVTQFSRRYESIDKFLSQADQALYQAKKSGRDRVCFSKD